MNNQRFWKAGVIASILLIVNLVVIYTQAQFAYEAGILMLSKRVLFFLGYWGVTALLALGFVISAILSPDTLETLISKGFTGLGRLGKLNLFFYLALIVGFVFGWNSATEGFDLNWLSRFLLYAQVTILLAVLLKGFTVHHNWNELLAISALFAVAELKVASFIPEITNYPFSIGWSEGSQHYFASLFFSQQIYDQKLPLPVLHPSQYLLQSIPFFMGGAPLWFHRLWEALLWLGLAAIAGYSFARRIPRLSHLQRWILIGWVFIFLFIGPVYYHLLISLILILWAFNPFSTNKKGSIGSICIVVLASIWAGISRVNWFPVPGILAASLYIIHVPKNQQSLPKYLIKPFVWIGFGTITAILAYLAYISLSGNPPEQFTSSFTSTLLWNRLLPNVTYRLGILPAISLVSIPLWLIIILNLGYRNKLYHPIRHVSLLAMNLVLFLGGLVVSVKIGGGSNLHNMDAYMVHLMLITAWIYFDRYDPDLIVLDGQQPISDELVTPFIPIKPSFKVFPLFQLCIFSAFVIPILFIMPNASTARLADRQAVETALLKISQYTTHAAQQGGLVLFISERQLLTFHQIKDISLVLEYEKVFLMEMAMSGNRDYLNHFYEDIANHRFALIVSEPVNLPRYSSSREFAEENNVWRKYINKRLLCYYSPVVSLKKVGVEILAPRADNGCG